MLDHDHDGDHAVGLTAWHTPGMPQIGCAAVVLILFITAIASCGGGDSSSDSPSRGSKYTPEECQALRMVALDNSRSMDQREDAVVQYDVYCR